jgi:ABC-type transporter Mla MlaB component
VLTVCTTEQGWPDQTRLDLSGLTYVDQAGTRLLKEFLRRGVAVTACSGFVAELLHLEKS